MQGSSDETANSGEDASSGPGSSSGHSDGSSNEVNSSHASQSAGSPASEVRSEDMADSEVLKEEDDDDDDDEGEESPQNESRNPELRTLSAESQSGICMTESPGGTECDRTNSGPGKDISYSTDTVPSGENRIRLLDTCSHAEDSERDMTGEINTAHISQGSQESCITRTGDFLGEAIGNEIFNCRRFIGQQHHHHDG